MEENRSGARIRSARIARGMTQAELASAVGVSRSAVAQWETERAGQVRGHLSRIAFVLGVSVGYLVEGEPQADVGSFDAAELAMLRLFRKCDLVDRQLLLRLGVRLTRSADSEEVPP